MKRLALALSVVLWTSQNLVFAASFECNKAHTRVEKLICSTEELSKADSALGEAYRYVLANSNDDHRKSSMVVEQKEWLTTVRDKCEDSICLDGAYWGRIGQLTKIKTPKSAAIFVWTKSEREKITAKFQNDIRAYGISVKLSACNLMIELTDSPGGRDQSYGAICMFNNRTVMVCNDTMVGKLTIKLSGFAIIEDDLVDFTEENCPIGG